MSGGGCFRSDVCNFLSICEESICKRNEAEFKEFVHIFETKISLTFSLICSDQILNFPDLHMKNKHLSNNLHTSNLVPRVVSEPLFQSSSHKTTPVQGVVFGGEFDFIAMKFRMAVRVWRHKHFVDMKILYLQQDVGQDP